MALISKVKSPSHLDKFRSISLVRFLNKLVDKLLATRFGPVMDKFISPIQLTFFKVRMPVDGVVVTDEVIEYLINLVLSLRLIFRKCMIQLVGIF